MCFALSSSNTLHVRKLQLSEHFLLALCLDFLLDIGALSSFLMSKGREFRYFEAKIARDKASSHRRKQTQDTWLVQPVL